MIKRFNSFSPSVSDPAHYLIRPYDDYTPVILLFSTRFIKKNSYDGYLDKTEFIINHSDINHIREVIALDYILRSARYLAGEMLSKVVRPGDAVVDATMGNGHDTLFLCRAVGPEGRVYAFDIQQQAVTSTEALLRANYVSGSASLFCVGHENMDQFVPEKVRAIVFNLGWLPGGDHSMTTRWETTRTAVIKALDLLMPGGMLVLCAYPGHNEGCRERDGLVSLFSSLCNRTFNVLHQRFLNASVGAPECFAVQRMA